MVASWVAQTGPATGGEGWGAFIIPIVSVVATAITVAFTAILNRRKGNSDFLAEVLRENEYLRGRNHELLKDIQRLEQQNKELGQENVRMLRAEHTENLDRLEKMVERFERLSEVFYGDKRG